MRCYRKASVALLAGIFLTTLSSLPMTHETQASAIPAAPSYTSGMWTASTNDSSFSPWAIAIDSHGHLFATDNAHRRIAECPRGSSTWKDITNGGSFNEPAGIAVDQNGDVFVTNANVNPYTIEELPSGSTTWKDITYGGTFATPWGIAADSNGDVFVADPGDNTIQELPSGGTTWEDITNGGSLHSPRSIAVDQKGDVFVTDYTTLKELPSGSSTWSDIPGGAVDGIAVDSRGDVYALDVGNKAIKELPSGSKTWEYIASDASLQSPTGIAVDRDGGVFVTDEFGGTNIYEFFPMPMIKGIQVAPGTKVGTTKLTVTANTKGDRLEYVLRASRYHTLGAGETGPADAISLMSGLTKDNIPTSAWVGRYLDVYELNGSGKVVAFAQSKLTSAVITQNPGQIVHPKQWDGQWYRLNPPAFLTLYNATSQTVDFKFREGAGTAYINGNTAVYRNGNSKITFVMTPAGQVQVLAQNASNVSWDWYVPQVNLNGMYVKKNPLPRVTLSVTKQNKATIAGRTLFAPGSWLVIEVMNGELMPIYWETTVGKGGIIDSEEDISWLSGTQNLVAHVNVMSHSTGSGYKDMGTILQVASNPAQMTIQQKNMGQDVRKYYKPGTPAYTVADFVYRDGSGEFGDSKGMGSDTLPGHGVTNLSPGNDWIQLNGVDIYGLHYVSKTSAVADTTLLIGSYYTDQSLNYTPVGGPTLYFDYEFKLTKYQGKWLIDGIDLDNALSRLYDVPGVPVY